ncbi:ATP-binding protein [Cytobacillus sp. NCCP-133]|uniref:ATP-binding protein n=1 Tax=Cytobacillus sp. NCCP-133 TaxID=766848 RepID=UPI00222E75C1|nr:ATP-binding protein [Cytobacillus sp. NCCP-133]GLB60782.1 hypothetical protein NCCP133_29140 [Cytobacillus sp. NCCP-133]
MVLTETLCEKLPFPYFLITDKYEILTASLDDHDHLSGRLFTDLLSSDEREFFTNLLNDKGNGVFNIKIEDDYNPHRVYLAAAEVNRFHLFCFPLSIEDDETKKTAAQLDKKLFQNNLQLMEKKKYIERTAIEIHEASLASDYMANVDQLAAGIAHEIRNPLTTVKGFIQLLKPYLFEIGKEQYADIALGEINRANEIIYEFLNTAKPAKNIKTDIAINKIIKEMAILFDSEARLQNIDLSIELSNADPYVAGDSKQIKQVLVNIIKNALEALQYNKRPQSCIQIKSEVKHSKSIIIVGDNGPGMAQETLDQLFTPFFTTKEKGTGIGLMVCKKIIEAHEGCILINSQPDAGTIFKIELPLSKTNAK